MSLVYKKRANAPTPTHWVYDYLGEMRPFVRRIDRPLLKLPLVLLKSIEWGIYRWYETPIQRFYGVKGNELIYMITRRCNDRCAKCGIWKTPEPDSEHLPVEHFLECLNRLHENLYQLTLTGGEPLMYAEDVLRIAEEAKKLDVPMYVVTNGALLTEAFLDRYAELGHVVVISLDTIDKEKWSSFRGRNHFDHVMHNVLLARQLLGANLRVQSVLAKESEGDVSAVAAFCREHQIPHVVQPHMNFGGTWHDAREYRDDGAPCAARKNICSRDVAVRRTFDALRRPTHLYVKIGSASEFLAERTLYGEGLSDSTTPNLRGRVYRVYDSAGVVTHVTHDFKGNLLESNRVLAKTYASTPDWSSIASITNYATIESTAASDLESETFTQAQAFDALNRVTSTTLPDSTQVLPTYNEANLLEAVDVKIRGDSTSTPFVRNVDYNARGQRTLIEYAGSSSAAFSTEYAYDAMTFRLSNQTTTRASDSAVLQDFSPIYDPVGNIVELLDAADQTIYFSGTAPVGAGTQYEYDPIYRLLSASGREHPGQQMPNETESPLASVPHPNDLQAMRAYSEDYEYDEVGNILAMLHSASGNNWNRHYTYASGNNKLETTEMPGDPNGGPYSGTYAHDARGNMTAMPHLSSIGWDWADRMQSADLGGGGDVYFTYDSSGQRVRKMWDKTSSLRDERIYLGAFELWRESTVSGGTATVQEERQTAHVMDDVRRVAMVETKTVTSGNAVSSPTPRQRYQLSNQIESASVELTEDGSIISYEEYFPFGATSFRSADGSGNVSAKSYRYTGKERDEETGLYYHGARYYAPWLGRWTAVDPGAMKDGPNRYVYVGNRPLTLLDRRGQQGEHPSDIDLRRYGLQGGPAIVHLAPGQTVPTVQANPDERAQKLVQGAPWWSMLVKGAGEGLAVLQGGAGGTYTHITPDPREAARFAFQFVAAAGIKVPFKVYPIKETTEPESYTSPSRIFPTPTIYLRSESIEGLRAFHAPQQLSDRRTAAGSVATLFHEATHAYLLELGETGAAADKEAKSGKTTADPYRLFTEAAAGYVDTRIRAWLSTLTALLDLKNDPRGRNVEATIGAFAKAYDREMAASVFGYEGGGTEGEHTTQAISPGLRSWLDQRILGGGMSSKFSENKQLQQIVNEIRANGPRPQP